MGRFILSISWETKICFSRQRIVETGLKHGTVTVLAEDGAYEVTTIPVAWFNAPKHVPNTAANQIGFIAHVSQCSEAGIG